MIHPKVMRAVRNTTHGGPHALRLDEVPLPVPANDEVLIRVEAAGVTFPDVLQTRGDYQLRIPLPFTVGCEFAGVIVGAPAMSPYAVGDRVAAIGPAGAFAEYAVANEKQVLPLPDSVDFLRAAGMPMNVLTADFAVQQRGNLRAGETVLIHGAAGGLGVALIQRAKLAGARVIAVVSTPAKEVVARGAGADVVIHPDGFLQEIRQITSGRGIDMVLDPVGGDRFTDSLRSLAANGRLLVLGFAGRSIPTVKVNRLLLNNIAVVGVGWGGLMANGRISPHEQWMNLLPEIQSGRFDPVIGDVVPFDRALQAIASLDERRAAGKILIQVGTG
ncbi:NADPH:quinone oxidoreductase family protein [Pseudarthrobacter sp. fls2-241-R2A-168]|uniref:NADPH:quinone oxidoreductase family protein n=1 Tax=Pseudarthrobacter sp. fls2-241-R2A-168 TaxID=3040304 RepID=UPI0025552141|nr:NADPH:quinone oxidoreductase family protein [Pseudarthrobacter sp. fls2-241-R2A-168]